MSVEIDRRGEGRVAMSAFRDICKCVVFCPSCFVLCCRVVSEWFVLSLGKIKVCGLSKKECGDGMECYEME